jgi:hypothetical protein
VLADRVSLYCYVVKFEGEQALVGLVSTTSHACLAVSVGAGAPAAVGDSGIVSTRVLELLAAALLPGSGLGLGEVPRARVLIPNVSPSRAVNLLLLLFSSSSLGLVVAARCSCTRLSAAIRSCGVASSIRRGFKISQKPLRRREVRLCGASSPPSRGGGRPSAEDGERLLEGSAFAEVVGRRSIRLEKR